MQICHKEQRSTLSAPLAEIGENKVLALKCRNVIGQKIQRTTTFLRENKILVLTETITYERTCFI